jgi:hypothetical protein
VTKSSSGKQMAGIWRELGGLLLILLLEGTIKVLDGAIARLPEFADDGEVTGLGLSTSIRIASSSSTCSLLLFLRGGRRGVGAGEGMGVGTSLMGDRHFPYSIMGISRRIVGGCCKDELLPPVYTNLGHKVFTKKNANNLSF